MPLLRSVCPLRYVFRSTFDRLDFLISCKLKGGNRVPSSLEGTSEVKNLFSQYFPRYEFRKSHPPELPFSYASFPADRIPPPFFLPFSAFSILSFKLQNHHLPPSQGRHFFPSKIFHSDAGIRGFPRFSTFCLNFFLSTESGLPLLPPSQEPPEKAPPGASEDLSNLLLKPNPSRSFLSSRPVDRRSMRIERTPRCSSKSNPTTLLFFPLKAFPRGAPTPKASPFFFFLRESGGSSLL